MAEEMLKFCALESGVDPTFWAELAARKLDEYKLSEAPVDIAGYLTASRHAEVPSQVLVLAGSFGAAGGGGGSGGSSGGGASAAGWSAQGAHALPGRLHNFNTAEGFARADAKSILADAGAEIWADIQSGAAEADPSLLCRFVVLAFGDLKRYRFTYRFGFPALKPPAPFGQRRALPLGDWAGGDAGAAKAVLDACDAWRGLCPHDSGGAGAAQQQQQPAPFWLVEVDDGCARALPLASWPEVGGADAAAAAAAGLPEKRGQKLLLLAMSDPSHVPLTPGWPLRNLLLLVAARWRVERAAVVCVRDGRAGRADAARSFVVDAALPLPADDYAGTVGWEANAAGKQGPRRVDLSASMAPAALAEQAVDLNLKLMRWSAAPDLDVASLAAQRCLLLGAGTLGCAVARTLLAWGVRAVTFVDSGRVAYSNPVRQSLYVFQDCLNGGRPKAAAAAEAVRAIFPSARCEGVELEIPMPGHAPADEAAASAAAAAAAKLDELVAAHDAVFLLTDSRESRWLPALLAAARRRVAITAALGFDGFVVMRHGLPPPEAGCNESSSSSGSSPPERPGCYFCNDVVAPANSAVDRTLDQQCTVARPGLAPIASALAVELLAALLQHPLRGDAPAPAPAAAAAGSTDGPAPSSLSGSGGGALGPVPHMLRGQLFGFTQVAMQGRAFSQCTACSPAALAEWRARGPAFVVDAMRRPGLLEEVTGLAELHRAAAAAAEAYELKAAAAAAARGGGGDGGDGGGSGDEEDWTEL